MVSIEDARFYEHSGVDFQGIGRALVKDILSQSAAQGASTITEQFVKNALEAEGSRTVFEKFREAALAYRLERHWSKDKILTEYLNTIYFGEGAYGIEAAARTYFGSAHPGCGTPTEPCASVLEPWEAATLAGDHRLALRLRPQGLPRKRPRRGATWCWKRCTNRATSPHEQFEEGSQQALPSPDDIEPPTLDSKAPYFTAWLRQQLVERYGAAKAFFGGLKVKSTLDLRLQGAAEEAVNSYLGYSPATASVVVHRQQQRRRQGDGRRARLRNQALQPGDPGPPPARLLDQAVHADHRARRGDLPLHDLRIGAAGHSTSARTARKPSTSPTTRTPTSAPATSSARRPTPTTRSTPSSALEGLKGKTIQDRTRSIAATIHKMGYADPISTNPAMVLGGLEAGVTPLGWTYAYTTIANNGDRVSGTLAPRPGDSPVAYTQVTDQDGHTIKDGDNDSTHKQVIPEGVAEEAKSILETVVSSGTGINAHIGASGQWGKTGTTENNGDAWFCGGDRDEVTACVWVGYADTMTPMTTLYNGGPVMGGTFPALIWASVISAWEEIKAERAAEAKEEQGEATATPARSSGSHLHGAGIIRANRKSKPTPEASEPAKKPRAEARRNAAEPAAPGTRRRTGGALQRRRRHRRLAAAASRRSGLPAAQKRQGRSTALVIPIRGPVTTSAPPVACRRAAAGTGRAPRSAPFCSRPMPSASVSLPGPEQRSRSGRSPRRAPHRLQAGGRLERPDQHRGRLALGFGDEVEQAVDAVGEVDVGAARAGRRGPRCGR